MTDIQSSKENFAAVVAQLRGMDRVDALIRAKLSSEAPRLEEIPTYLLNLGGKRMRPLLTLLIARGCRLSDPSEELIQVAAGIELIHMATLLHDDIIDNSSLRRHKDSPLQKYGASDTLLAGDFLLVRAFSLCAQLDKQIIDATEQACVELTEGEILETDLTRDQHNIDTSLNVARKKTAALFRLACFCGSYLANVDKRTTQALAVFGENLGIAFQILDDILDVTSDEDLLGKKTGTDLRERKPSLVNILWLESDSTLAPKLRDASYPLDEKFIDQALAELRNGSIIDQTRSLAHDYANRARAALEQALSYQPEFDARIAESLESMLVYTLDRMQ